MEELDKDAMGRRIRQIRLGASLRQWELAKLLGTTQSAVHKYEHGVVPEPRRLIELARIGGTSVEWVLTGRHWENGSEEQERVSPDLLRTACLLREVEQGRSGVDEALRIVRDAARALDERGAEATPVEQLHGETAATLDLLRKAQRIQLAVIRRIRRDAGERLAASPLGFEEAGEAEEADERPDARRTRS